MSVPFRRLRHNERGMSLVLISVGLLGFLAATTLAIDVGMFMTARSQAQNAADAGALSGVIALYFNDWDDRSADGPAVQSALNTARQTGNEVMGAAVSVTPPDVTFPNDPDGQPTRVKVDVFRTAERGNPIQTLIGQYFGVSNVNIAATATAEAVPANGMTCIKPFVIPDRWREMNAPPYNDQTSRFAMYDNRGNPLANPDIYIPATDPANYTGYNNEADRGRQLVLRAGSGNNIEPSSYYSLAIGVGGEDNPGGLTGGEAYDWNITNCNHSVIVWGQLVVQEPGNMVGPTVQGVEGLIARDPNAYWNTATNKVAGSAFPGQSPRVAPIPLYDPIYYEEGKQNGRFADFKVANWIGFFFERVVGNQIYGRIIPITGIATSGPAPAALFPRAIRLVQ
jgi:Putative Flp pilus-assembly TadE/G-like